MCRRGVWLTVIFAALVSGRGPARAQEASVSVYGQASNQQQTHVMPRVSVRTPPRSWLRAEAAYFVDVSSRASLSQTARTEQRSTRTQHELTALFGVDTARLRAAGHYRFVSLPDYTSHTITIPCAYGWSDWATKLTLQPYARWNEARRIGDPSFARSSSMFGVRVGIQPWLDGRTVGQLSYELQYASGYLASPYNFVCTGVCLPERLPEQRLQHAAVLQGRRALSEFASFGLLYRFFVDDWSMTSHTLEPDVALLLWRGGLVRLRYRLYLQSATEAYRAAQATQPLADSADSQTIDARWAELHTQRASLELEHTFTFENMALMLLATVGHYRVALSDNVNASSNALEGTAFAALRF